MKVAVMQPYFFPYIGYFQLIKSVDKFVFFDDVQFNKKSFMVRNKIQTKGSDLPYYIRPNIKKNAYKENLNKIVIEDNSFDAFFKQIDQYKDSIYYDETIQLINKLNFNYKLLVDFNINSIKLISKYLKINVDFIRYSKSTFIVKNASKGEWGYLISKKMNATKYINSSGGEDFIFPETFKNMKLGFIQNNIDNNLSVIHNLFTFGRNNVINSK